MRSLFSVSLSLGVIFLVGCSSAPGAQQDSDAGPTPAADGSTSPSSDGGSSPDAPGAKDASSGPDGSTPADGSTTADASPAKDGGAQTKYLHAVGSTLVDGQGNTVQLHGVNRSGTEFACAQGWGLFDGPSDDASLAAIASWKNVNAVRVPMNEDCWLGINGVQAQYGGANYQKALSDFADRILAHGMHPILELHWTAPGTTLASGQQPMPDMDHSVTFWSQVAAAFAARPDVVLELHNEPYPDGDQDTNAAWTCWQNGGTCSGINYQVAGMQTLVSAVRAAGANNLVLLGGVQYSNSLSQWLTHVPTDPAHNLAAAWHVYNFNVCSSTSCYDSTAGAVAKQYPIVATEIGEDDCGGGFITPLMGWLDGKQQSYLAWTWDTWGNCLDLISSYSGSATTPYGTTFKNHIAGL
ncbi:MAG TPA: cellulase family glycosylhydrolase [Polyangiaceae bacterium]|nr:cellulase family glycosylhydrolase [Polyangiaceae bacterium]